MNPRRERYDELRVAGNTYSVEVDEDGKVVATECQPRWTMSAVDVGQQWLSMAIQDAADKRRNALHSLREPIGQGTKLDNGATVIHATKRIDTQHQVVLAMWRGEYVVWLHVSPDDLTAEIGHYYDTIEDAVNNYATCTKQHIAIAHATLPAVPIDPNAACDSCGLPADVIDAGGSLCVDCTNDVRLSSYEN